MYFRGSTRRFFQNFKFLPWALKWVYHVLGLEKSTCRPGDKFSISRKIDVWNLKSISFDFGTFIIVGKFLCFLSNRPLQPLGDMLGIIVFENRTPYLKNILPKFRVSECIRSEMGPKTKKCIFWLITITMQPFGTIWKSVQGGQIKINFKKWRLKQNGLIVFLKWALEFNYSVNYGFSNYEIKIRLFGAIFSEYHESHGIPGVHTPIWIMNSTLWCSILIFW